MSSTRALLDIASLGDLHHLDVIARAVVDGMQAGMHRSPHKGHSVDFADHRPYVPGDDLRHLDWKVLGKSDRLVLKRYEAETDMALHLIVDGSGSMSYEGARSSVTKFRYASIVAATLAHLTLNQQDRVGLQIFSDEAQERMKPSQQVHFDHLCSMLDGHECLDGTDARKGVRHIAAPTSRRGLVALFSDCMGDLDTWKKAFDRLALRGHDIIVVWILDIDEKDLAIDAVTRFLGLEDEGELVCEPRAVREAYLEQVEQHKIALLQMCRARKISLIEAVSSDAPAQVLNKILVELQSGK
ncbi:MAG: DUF58 domain-containing protein [Planctomycetes bacterium]|nr:DUF58 domain-containing protein [Planctomycetota bacterium]